ncbi:MAG: PQQ-dependent sugar dehydrogenase, partial [Thermoanaerobaculia bacterium]
MFQGFARSGFGVVLLLVVAGATAHAAEPIELTLVAEGLTQPLALVHAGDGSRRLFIVEQGGRILIHDGTGLLPDPFLDISSRVNCCGERGLLGLAFHPDYASNGFFFVNYTESSGDTVISRFSVSGDPNRADGSSETEVLSFAQPFANHNGGQLAFGPDGHLYIASGDGGSGGDPRNNGQQLDTLLGKILRIDVDELPFGIPPDNPFVDNPSARAEIWAFGLRNPWRFSFDRSTGDLFIADVGQDRREEVDFQPAGSPGGENYGWRRMEGSLCFNPSGGCNDGSLVLPILEYDHDLGCSVTGGYVYRGTEAPGLEGNYLFGDFCSGLIWGATPGLGGAWAVAELAGSDLAISSFGEDGPGELYV